jgi:hypothetical protein
VEEEVSKPLSMSLHILPKPSFSRTSSKKAQETESKAFEISNFKIILGCFCECRNLAVCCTNIKLSWINRPLINALWLEETIPSSRPANLLATLCYKLCKTVDETYGSEIYCMDFFGSRVILAELSNLRFLKSLLHTSETAAMMSSLIMGQHTL